ncbi:M48 family metallopeptidase [Acidipila sp. EB88]|uniref:M48 family metallopeptidase n=1 Tax=Acidipila sp. EB88 TaxID=2305226 RepID=UPI000F5FA38A|nr:M48 family metallopeptidase [Acidipila sp. EB88]RRA47936.1 M48 family peptidase [Acidipila sp. EB88]
MLNAMLLLAVPAQAPAYVLPPALLAKAHALELLHTALYFGGTLWELLALALLLRWGAGSRLARWARSLTRHRGGGPFTARPWLEGLVLAPLWLAILALIALPGSLVSHSVRVRFGLSVEHWWPWWGDWAAEEGMTLLLGTLLLSAVFALIRWSPRRWWLWFWLLIQPIVVLGVFLAPIAIDPLFNRFTPLATQDAPLVARLEQVARLGGLAIPPERMFMEDASKRDTGMNAYVTGIGASKRIVVWDTTLQRVPPDEILAIYAHEQGHYVLGHIWKGILFEALLTLGLFALLARLFRWAVERFEARWHVTGVTDYAALPVLLFLASCLSFLSAPVSNAISRFQEHAADVYGQQLLTRLLPNAAEIEVDDFNRLGRAWLEDPAPPRFVVWWTYTHPPVADRAEEARRMPPQATPKTQAAPH